MGAAMTTTFPRPSLWQVMVAEPLDLIKAQPHQILLSTGSVALLGQFAGSGGIVNPMIGYAIAIGIEWAYLRGLASDSQAPTIWGAILNWSAFGVVVLWGVLWCLKAFGVHAAQPTGDLALLLALAHVMPVAWLSLCSAMTHRAAMQLQTMAERVHQAEERSRSRQVQSEHDTLALENAREDAKLARWKEAQAFKAGLKHDATDAKHSLASSGIVPVTIGKTASCPQCHRDVAYQTASEAGTIRRWGCPACRAAKKHKETMR